MTALIDFFTIPGLQVTLVISVFGVWAKIILAAIKAVADAIGPHRKEIEEIKDDIHELRESRAAENTAMKNVEKRMDEISVKLDRLLERGK